MSIKFDEALRAIKQTGILGADTPIKINPNLKKIAGYSNVGNLLRALKREAIISNDFTDSEFFFVGSNLFRLDVTGDVDENGAPERRVQYVLTALLPNDSTNF